MAFEELKQRQSFVWGAAPFENIEAQIAPMHDDLVARLEPQPGERWLDLACGTGAIAFRAARAGADVTGSDLSPALIETARRLAAEQGLEVDLEVGDCEALSYQDGSFDVVSSSVGLIFAPDQRAAAGELARVCRSSGRIGVTAWCPDSGIGDFFALLKQFQPPLPEGAGNPLDWGREQHAKELLGETFDLRFVEGDAPQMGDSGEALWELFRDNFGPTKTLYESLDPDRAEELARAMVDFYESHRANGGIHQERRYLVILGTRR
jgi:SAM-dependent methyltransferase